jgi:hypothetical protein
MKIKTWTRLKPLFCVPTAMSFCCVPQIVHDLIRYAKLSDTRNGEITACPSKSQVFKDVHLLIDANHHAIYCGELALNAIFGTNHHGKGVSQIGVSLTG